MLFLDLIIGEYLFKTYPDMAEGDLTKIKAATVCEGFFSICESFFATRTMFIARSWRNVLLVVTIETLY